MILAFDKELNDDSAFRDLWKCAGFGPDPREHRISGSDYGRATQRTEPSPRGRGRCGQADQRQEVRRGQQGTRRGRIEDREDRQRRGTKTRRQNDRPGAIADRQEKADAAKTGGHDQGQRGRGRCQLHQASRTAAQFQVRELSRRESRWKAAARFVCRHEEAQQERRSAANRPAAAQPPDGSRDGSGGRRADAEGRSRSVQRRSHNACQLDQARREVRWRGRDCQAVRLRQASHESSAEHADQDREGDRQREGEVRQRPRPGFRCDLPALPQRQQPARRISHRHV